MLTLPRRGHPRGPSPACVAGIWPVQPVSGLPRRSRLTAIAVVPIIRCLHVFLMLKGTMNLDYRYFAAGRERP
jgi:hypothetical protein